MGRCNVEYKGKWAAFSTIVDDFITKFMEKEEYEQWCLEEYGRANFVPVKKATADEIEDIVFSIRLNRTHEQAFKCLLVAGLSENECEKLLYDVETEHWVPQLNDKSKYECPNCGEIVVKGQERCTDETCDLEFVWR